MQKGETRSKTIILSLLIVLMCVSLIVGATLALFTSSDQHNISVQTGEVNVTGNLTIGKVSSSDQDGGNYNETVFENGTTDAKLLNGGSASVDDNGNVSIQGIAQGETVSLNLEIVNDSSIDIRYLVTLETQDAQLFEIFEFTYNGQSIDKNADSIVYEKWMPLSVGENANVNGIEISMPWLTEEVDADITGPLTGEFTLTLRAVQYNAVESTGDEELATATLVDENGNRTAFTSLQEALAAANASDSPVTLNLFSGVYQSSDLLNVQDGVSIKGSGAGATIIETTSAISNQAGMYVRGSDVTIEGITVRSEIGDGNVSALKVGGDAAQNIVIKDVTIEANGEASALNIHNADNVTVSNVTLENYGKVGIAIAAADGVTIEGVNFAEATDASGDAVWGDIGLMWKNDDDYDEPVSNVTLGAGNVFALNKIYSDDITGASYSEYEGYGSGYAMISGYEQYGLAAITSADTAYWPEGDEAGWILVEANAKMTIGSGETAAYATFMDITSAFDAINSNSSDEELTLEISEGQYDLTAYDLRITRDNVTVKGAGRDETGLNISTSGGQASVAVIASNVTISDLTFNVSNSTKVSLMKISGQYDSAADPDLANVSIENVTLKGTGEYTGKHAVDINGAYNVTLDGVILENYTGRGIQLRNTDGGDYAVTVSNTSFNGTPTLGWSVGRDIGYEYKDGDSGNGLIILGEGNEFNSATPLAGYDYPIGTAISQQEIPVPQGWEEYGFVLTENENGTWLLGAASSSYAAEIGGKVTLS